MDGCYIASTRKNDAASQMSGVRGVREMSNLDKALETLKETKKGTEWGDRMHKEAIEYLESLKPIRNQKMRFEI